MLNNGNKTKPGTTISLVIVFTVCMVLTVIRWLDIFNADIYVINETVNSHITNFTLSLLLCTFIGYLLLSAGKKYISNTVIGILLIIANFIYELLLPVLNTRDVIDALYGLAGVTVSLIYLFVISRYGFVKEKQL
ncbi:MAG: hypothetical protein PUG78_05325 [Eubacteriales bacterium]|nr:hypothetical protein [Clostridiales bacterium]MDD7307814.1 hypothetical protein [Eubacteriales bacterium]MDY2932592.1 hypothetical protein [Anaerovoracaceae bacterium]